MNLHGQYLAGYIGHQHKNITTASMISTGCYGETSELCSRNTKSCRDLILEPPYSEDCSNILPRFWAYIVQKPKLGDRGYLLIGKGTSIYHYAPYYVYPPSSKFFPPPPKYPSSWIIHRPTSASHNHSLRCFESRHNELPLGSADPHFSDSNRNPQLVPALPPTRNLRYQSTPHSLINHR
ncbi:hypothetical protein BYT27DRAFT_6676830 [Phlegmacium glaucopus]|nr:hypothetical protein BYT27DRAFT_6676830 [Phlegmacium glaucopus]